MRTEEALTRDERALDAAGRLVTVQQQYAARGMTMAQAALAGARAFVPMRHYPSDDCVDRAGGTLFYYHAHGSRRRPSHEHGHFHLFVRTPDAGVFHHLAALSLDTCGWPIRWFTTNRWVTGERWIDAPAAIEALRRFHPRATGRLAPVAAWLDAMVTLYQDTLAALLHRRDASILRRTARSVADDVFEDRRLDVVSEVRIALPALLARLATAQTAPTARADDDRAAGPAPRSRSRIPGGDPR